MEIWRGVSSMRRALCTMAVATFCLASSAYAQDSFLHEQRDAWPQRTAIPGVVFGSKISIEEQPCCGPGRGVDAGKLPDAEIIAHLRDRAFRDRRVLKLRLLRDRTMRIVDCDTQSGCPEDSVRLHRLADWWSDNRYYVVNVYGYEEHSAYLIRETDGLVVDVAAAPVLSPNGRYGLAWDASLMSGPNMQLLDLRSEPPKLRDITQTIACSGRKTVHPGQKAVWLSNTMIAFDGSATFDDNSARFRMTLEIAGDTMLRWQCH